MFFFALAVVPFSRLDEGIFPQRRPRVQIRYAAALLLPGRLQQGVAPPEILSILFCFAFSWPSGVFPLGWWGSPCCVFSSPRFLVLGGWVGFFCLFLRFLLVFVVQPYNLG